MYLSSDIPSEIIPEKAGKKKDLTFLENDKWLLDSIVHYLIQYRKGRWFLTMVYIYSKNPFQLLCRKIDHYPSEKRALTYAQIFQRGIRKDARGTLKLNPDAFRICSN
ncbi:MAG: hypothetical protein MRY78_11000 [Saprospiraceae bacterium]|nr:hypothetical protein [Saprospiraceae bacterium]